ncbi:MAG: nicotinate-nucleotide adenylyltransferase [Cyclobacteriaceae bacterium]
MKKLKLMPVVGVFVLGFTISSFGQVELPEIEVTAVNYKYLNSANMEEEAEPVRRLQLEAAAFDVQNSDFYQDEYDFYYVSFFIPEGKILASYDKDGQLLRTAEKFKNVEVPKAVRESVAKRFPQWVISKDVYLVNYHDEKGSKKTYKLLLENGNKRLKVKTDENGEFL